MFYKPNLLYIGIHSFTNNVWDKYDTTKFQISVSWRMTPRHIQKNGDLICTAAYIEKLAYSRPIEVILSLPSHG